MAEPEYFGLFMHPFFTNVILPFLLMFVVIYAILEKTALLGKERRYANIIVALVIGFIFVGVQSVVGFTLRLIPLVAMLIMVLLCLYLIFGFIGTEKTKWMQISLGIVFGVAFIIIVLWAVKIDGVSLLHRFTGTEMRGNVTGIVTLLVALGMAIALVLTPVRPGSVAAASTE